MNDLMSRMLFSFVVAERQGVERSEAMKIGLLSSIDNSKNLMMPVLNAKFRADDKTEIEDLKASKEILAADLLALREEAKKLVVFIYNADTTDVDTIKGHIDDNTTILKDYK
ncbi:MAG: hypothetical protein R2828_07385 [Saprospiraceae bacterium]